MIKALEMIAMMLEISFLIAIIYGISDIEVKDRWLHKRFDYGNFILWWDPALYRLYSV